jgi:hypothetical protein
VGSTFTGDEPQTRAALIIMAQKLYDMASNRPADFEAAQREFNDRQMTPQPTMQQQQQIRRKREE